MEMAEDDVEDSDVDTLIANMQADITNKKNKQLAAELEPAED